MSLIIRTAAPAQQSSKGIWPAVAPYVIPVTAASLPIVPVFFDMIAKSTQQKGQPVLSMTPKERCNE